MQICKMGLGDTQCRYTRWVFKMKGFIRVIAFLLRKVTAFNKKKSSSSPSFSLLPHGIIENCLARVPCSYYPQLSLVSKSFHSLLSSRDIYAARSRLGITQQCFYVCLECMDSSDKEYYYQWIKLSLNPSRTEKKKKKNMMIGQLAVRIPSSGFDTLSNHIIAGHEIYVICQYKEPSSTVKVLDCRSNTWNDAPSMNVARRSPVSYFYDGKIYVIGSFSRLLEHESWGEVFDIKTQTWECLPEPCFDEGTKYDYNYDPKECKWKKKSVTSSWPECEMMDNVLYSFENHDVRCSVLWRDINSGYSWKEVKGLDSLACMEKMWRNVSTTKVASCGGKLYIMWNERVKKNDVVNIWCAEISVEKRDGDEIWGNVEWFDVVHTNHTDSYSSCSLTHFLAISI